MSNPIEVIGREAVMRALQEYGPKVARKVVQYTELAQVRVMTEAKERHDENAHSVARFVTRTGLLEASIGVLPVALEGDVIRGPVIASMPYAQWVEYGTSRARAYPFMGPALYNNEKKYVDALRGAMRDADR